MILKKSEPLTDNRQWTNRVIVPDTTHVMVPINTYIRLLFEAGYEPEA